MCCLKWHCCSVALRHWRAKWLALEHDRHCLPHAGQDVRPPGCGNAPPQLQHCCPVLWFGLATRRCCHLPLLRLWTAVTVESRCSLGPASMMRTCRSAVSMARAISISCVNVSVSSDNAGRQSLVDRHVWIMWAFISASISAELAVLCQRTKTREYEDANGKHR